MAMLDIHSVFPELAQSARQRQEAEEAQRRTMDPMAAFVDRSMSNLNRNVRGGLYRATGNRGLLSGSQNMTKDIQGLDLNDPNAGNQLLASARKYAPERIPGIQAAMEQRRLAERQEARQDQADIYAKNQEARAANAERMSMQRQALYLQDWANNEQARVAELDRLKELRDAGKANLLAYYDQNGDKMKAIGVPRIVAEQSPEMFNQFIDMVNATTNTEAAQIRLAAQQAAQQGAEANKEYLENNQEYFQSLAGSNETITALMDMAIETESPELLANTLGRIVTIEENNKRELAEALEKAGSGRDTKPTEADITAADKAVLVQLGEMGVFRDKGWVFSRDFNPNEDLKPEQRSQVQAYQNRARFALRLLTQNGFYANDPGSISLAAQFAAGGISVNQMLDQLDPAAAAPQGGPSQGSYTPGTGDNAGIELDQLLNIGGYQGPRN